MEKENEKKLVRLVETPDGEKSRRIVIYVGQATYDLYQKALHDYLDQYQFSQWYCDNYMTMKKLRKQIKDDNRRPF